MSHRYRHRLAPPPQCCATARCTAGQDGMRFNGTAAAREPFPAGECGPDTIHFRCRSSRHTGPRMGTGPVPRVTVSRFLHRETCAFRYRSLLVAPNLLTIERVSSEIASVSPSVRVVRRESRLASCRTGRPGAFSDVQSCPRRRWGPG